MGNVWCKVRSHVRHVRCMFWVVRGRSGYVRGTAQGGSWATACMCMSPLRRLPRMLGLLARGPMQLSSNICRGACCRFKQLLGMLRGLHVDPLRRDHMSKMLLGCYGDATGMQLGIGRGYGVLHVGPLDRMSSKLRGWCHRARHWGHL